MKRVAQISVGILITAGITITLAGVTGIIGQFIKQSDKIGVLETRASVLETNFDNMNEKLEKIDLKLDAVLSKTNPSFRLPKIASSTNYEN